PILPRGGSGRWRENRCDRDCPRRTITVGPARGHPVPQGKRQRQHPGDRVLHGLTAVAELKHVIQTALSGGRWRVLHGLTAVAELKHVIQKTLFGGVGASLFLPRFAGADDKPARPDAGILGRWDLTVKGPDCDYPSWLEVRRSGYTTLVGSFVGQFGSARPI